MWRYTRQAAAWGSARLGLSLPVWTDSRGTVVLGERRVREAAVVLGALGAQVGGRTLQPAQANANCHIQVAAMVRTVLRISIARSARHARLGMPSVVCERQPGSGAAPRLTLQAPTCRLALHLCARLLFSCYTSPGRFQPSVCCFELLLSPSLFLQVAPSRPAVGARPAQGPRYAARPLPFHSPSLCFIGVGHSSVEVCAAEFAGVHAK